MTGADGVQKNKARVDFADVIAAKLETPYKPPPQKRGGRHMKIGWVLSPVIAGSGGIRTVARFARHLSDESNDVTIYLYEGTRPQSVLAAATILSWNYRLDVPVKMISDYDESDILIATGWETAYPVFNIETKAHKFYFVQDFEPMFYGAGSSAILAERTYTMGFYGITAGRWLADLLISSYGMECDFFDFGADIELYRPRGRATANKRKKVCFYARPATERRAFELGIMALMIFNQRHPEYLIELFGGDVSAYDIRFPYNGRGVLTQPELAALYQESVACIVLSLTNASLLPLELLAAGCVPIINDSASNRIVLGENEYVKYAEPCPRQLAEALISEVERTDIEIRAAAVCDSALNNSWQESYGKVAEILKREVFVSEDAETRRRDHL